MPDDSTRRVSRRKSSPSSDAPRKLRPDFLRYQDATGNWAKRVNGRSRNVECDRGDVGQQAPSQRSSGGPASGSQRLAFAF